MQSAGQTINNGIMSSDAGAFINGGLLRGTGTFTNPFVGALVTVTIANGGTLAPGDETTPGKLTINGNLSSSGNMLFEIGGLASGHYDVLQINGSALFTAATSRSISSMALSPLRGIPGLSSTPQPLPAGTRSLLPSTACGPIRRTPSAMPMGLKC